MFLCSLKSLPDVLPVVAVTPEIACTREAIFSRLEVASRTKPLRISTLLISSFFPREVLEGDNYTYVPTVDVIEHFTKNHHRNT